MRDSLGHSFGGSILLTPGARARWVQPNEYKKISVKIAPGWSISGALQNQTAHSEPKQESFIKVNEN